MREMESERRCKIKLRQKTGETKTNNNRGLDLRKNIKQNSESYTQLAPSPILLAHSLGMLEIFS